MVLNGYKHLITTTLVPMGSSHLYYSSYMSLVQIGILPLSPPPYRTISVLIVGEGIMDSREIAGQYIKINELYSTYMR